MTARGTLGSAEAYSIAWIASLPHERTAATAVLDERHHEPHEFNAQKHEHDRNSYSWGRIGHHCIVIASLPPGKYQGTNTATIVQGIISSLPHIRFGILLGTGTGLAGEKVNRSGETIAKRDIRLGDVVVASPGNDTDSSVGGVVQFDCVFTAEHPILERRVDFAEPPLALRAALSTLQSDHELDGSRLQEIMDGALQRFPSIRKLYSNPGVEKEWDEEDSESEDDSEDEAFTPDRLFKASYSHIGGNHCGDCAPTEELKRKKRKTSTPKVHFGMTVVLQEAFRTAVLRDEVVALLDEHTANIISLDAEAFGIPPGFPCLVLKGVSDYGDEHRYDRWQKFAALSVAAFARELLGFVGVGDVERSPKINELMSTTSQRSM